MKRKLNLTIIAISLASCTLFAQSKIQVPYFKTLSGTEICGSPNCNPTIGAWAQIKGGYLFDGDVKKVFGRKFGKAGIFDNSPCVMRSPNDNEFKTLKKGTLKGTLDVAKKNEFESKVNADLMKLIEQYADVTDQVKADLLAELKRTVEARSKAAIELEYKIIQLENDFLDSEIEKCRNNLNKNEKVIVGLSILTVSGNWNSNTLKELFTNFEANVEAFKALDVEAKYRYEQSKQKILNAQFEPFTMIFNVAYKQKL
jgi:hypothetical protein